jgi:hypothetical protein
MSGGFAENCTIADNQAGGLTYNGVSMTGGAITNTIVYFNQGGTKSVDKTGGSFGFCVAQEAVTGTNNLVVDPNFVDRAGGNYRLAAGSPCIDSGTNLPWVAAGKDLDVRARLVGSVVDRGAYENDPDNVPFSANFIGTPDSGHESQQVVFSASVAGSNKTGLVYSWSLGDGQTPSGGDKQVVTNTYGPGLYTVSLLVQNGGGETSGVVKCGYIRITTAATTYFSPSGSHTPPYTSWATAATNLQEAIDQTTTLVLVAPGQHYLPSQVNLTRGVTVRNSAPSTPTWLRRGAPLMRLFYVAHSNAVLDGFVIADGNINGTGGGVYMADGTIQNCFFTNNYAGDQGGGVTMDNGLVRNCRFIRNSASSGNASGGAIRMSGNSTVRNCLIVANYGQHRAGAIHMAGGTGMVENCTVVGNRGSYSEGCIHVTAGTQAARNCIVTNNINDGGTYFSFTGPITVTYSCVSPAVAGNGSISVPPSFFDEGNGTPGNAFNPGDYHLRQESPCANTGTNLAWMVMDSDLDGRPRISSLLVDMGCYEMKPPGMLFVVH